MTETNKLDEPLSDADYDELEAFLGSNVVPQDCMDLEMLDGFLTAIVSGPDLIQPSEWLPVLWSDSQRSVTPVFQNNEQAERILSLVLRLQQSIRRTLAESPTRFKPLLYHAETDNKDERSPPEASAWCEGFMTGVLLRDHDPEYLGWVDSDEKRLGMIDELPIATVLICRFWQERNRTDTPNRAERRAQRREASRKGRQRLH
jgi:yecA family protein